MCWQVTYERMFDSAVSTNSVIHFIFCILSVLHFYPFLVVCPIYLSVCLLCYGLVPEIKSLIDWLIDC